jgi:hypothetical protein
MNRGTLMLSLYRDIHHFVAVLRAADIATSTKAEIEFVIDLRLRWSCDLGAMRMTQEEHRRLTMLAVRGGSEIRAHVMPEIAIECSA